MEDSTAQGTADYDGPESGHDDLDASQRALLALADPRMDEAQALSVRQLLSERGEQLDWAWINDQAARHQVMPLIGWNIGRYRLHLPLSGTVKSIPHRWLALTSFAGNQQRNLALRDEFRIILDAAQQAGIPHAVRKGLVLAQRFYPDPGARRMTDLDVLVRRGDIPAFGDLLADLGFTQGRLTDTGAVKPFERSTRAFWALNVNNALPFVKGSELPHVERFEVDLCFDLVPAAGPGAEERTGTFLERAVPVSACGISTRRLANPDELLDLCVHLYKEADARHYIALGRDLALSKFLDVASCARAQSTAELEAVAAAALEFNVGHAVYFALRHTAELFPDAVPGRLLDRLRPDDPGVLDEFGHLEGKPVRWESSFRDRLFRTDRRERAGRGGLLPSA